VLSALLQAGQRPLLPFGDGHPYDLALDQDGELRRIQCKTGRLVRGSVVFATTRYAGRKHRMYQDCEIDYLGVHCPGTDAVYLVPISDVGPHTSPICASSRPRTIRRRACAGRWTMK
jgi:PD-(D/E)XK nuclease superfamily protein